MAARNELGDTGKSSVQHRELLGQFQAIMSRLDEDTSLTDGERTRLRDGARELFRREQAELALERIASALQKNLGNGPANVAMTSIYQYRGMYENGRLWVDLDDVKYDKTMLAIGHYLASLDEASVTAVIDALGWNATIQ